MWQRQVKGSIAELAGTATPSEGTCGRQRVWRRRFWLGCLALFGLPPLYVRVATPAPGPVQLSPLPTATTTGNSQAETSYRVYVAGWNYHTSIIVQQPKGWRLGPPGNESAPFVEYGWGDRRFFMERNYWPHALFITLFMPSASVVYIHGREQPPTWRQGVRELYARTVKPQQMHALVRQLEQALHRTAAGQRIEPHPQAAGSSDHFYPGREFYIFWADCNRWTVSQLQAVNLAGSNTLVFFDKQVAGRLRGFTPVQLTRTDEPRKHTERRQ